MKDVIQFVIMCLTIMLTLEILIKINDRRK